MSKAPVGKGKSAKKDRGPLLAAHAEALRSGVGVVSGLACAAYSLQLLAQKVAACSQADNPSPECRVPSSRRLGLARRQMVSQSRGSSRPRSTSGAWP